MRGMDLDESWKQLSPRAPININHFLLCYINCWFSWFRSVGNEPPHHTGQTDGWLQNHIKRTINAYFWLFWFCNSFFPLFLLFYSTTLLSSEIVLSSKMIGNHLLFPLIIYFVPLINVVLLFLKKKHLPSRVKCQ